VTAKARPEIPLLSNLQEASSNEIRSAGIGTPSEGLSFCDSAFCSTERQLCTRARPILFSRIVSLFPAKNSLFRLLGNLLRNRLRSLRDSRLCAAD
jgi:hypothetical protein